MNIPFASRRTASSSSSPLALRRPWPRWTREPLLHFVLLGGLLFAVDHARVARRDDLRTIVVGPEVDVDAARLFAASRGRTPGADERKALRQVWLDNEVLYREGLALQVDRGDDAIRDRVIFKALSVVDANVRLPRFDDAVLRAWFEAHRDRYDEPARFDFEEAQLAGAGTEPAVQAFVRALNAGTSGDAQAGLRVFKARPRPTLVQGYGVDFASALESAPPGEWRALATRDGWRAIRLGRTIPARAATFEPLRGVVLQDWTDATLSEQRSAAVRVLAGKYRIVDGTAGR